MSAVLIGSKDGFARADEESATGNLEHIPDRCRCRVRRRTSASIMPTRDGNSAGDWVVSIECWLTG